MKVERKEIVLVEMDSCDFDSLISFIKRSRDGITLDEVDIITAGRLYKDLLKANSISG
jgi:hypothetical protein